AGTVTTPGDGTPDVEGELALEHVVDLAGFVPVHDRRAAPGRHAYLHGEQRTARLRAGGEHGDLVAPEPDAFRGARMIDRILVHTSTIDRWPVDVQSSAGAARSRAAGQSGRPAPRGLRPAERRRARPARP